MALGAPDDFRETGLLPNIFGLGTNVIGGAISAAIERGKQASNLQAGQETNFYNALDNAINRNVRAGEFNATSAERKREFDVSSNLDATKVIQSAKQFDARLLFDKNRDAADRIDAGKLLDLRKKEVESLITSRSNQDKLATNADTRAAENQKRAVAKDPRDEVLFNLEVSNKLNEAEAITEKRRLLEEGRVRDAQLVEKSKTLFLPQDETNPTILKISPTATPDDMRSFVGEALTSRDPEVLGRAQALVKTQPTLLDAKTPQDQLELSFRVLDQTQASLDRALTSLKSLQTPKVDKDGKPVKVSTKDEQRLVTLVRSYQAIIGKEPKEIRAAWAASRKANGGVAVPGSAPGTAPAGPPPPLQKSAADYLPQ